MRALPSVIPEREWVAIWIELIDASLYTPPGTPRAGRILREAYADASIRLPVIRDLGLSLLPPAAKPVPRAVAAPDAVTSPSRSDPPLTPFGAVRLSLSSASDPG